MKESHHEMQSRKRVISVVGSVAPEARMLTQRLWRCGENRDFNTNARNTRLACHNAAQSDLKSIDAAAVLRAMITRPAP